MIVKNSLIVWKLNFLVKHQPWRLAGCFKIFEKMQAISLYWFATQQQTSTFRWEKSCFTLFYLKLSAELNELNFNLQKQQEVAKKWLKLKESGKTIDYVFRSLIVLRDWSRLRGSPKRRVFLRYFDSFSRPKEGLQ